LSLFLALSLALPVAAPAHAEPNPAGLLRLAEILGAVHHLRDVCGANEGALWRNKMIDMLDITNIPEDMRQSLISRFNSGFHRAERNYPVCTRKAARETNALLNEGRGISARLAADLTLSPINPEPNATN
jgi:uncharacterized protein (TIGR02301 family)